MGGSSRGGPSRGGSSRGGDSSRGGPSRGGSSAGSALARRRAGAMVLQFCTRAGRFARGCERGAQIDSFAILHGTKGGLWREEPIRRNVARQSKVQTSAPQRQRRIKLHCRQAEECLLDYRCRIGRLPAEVIVEHGDGNAVRHAGHAQGWPQDDVWPGRGGDEEHRRLQVPGRHYAHIHGSQWWAFGTGGVVRAGDAGALGSLGRGECLKARLPRMLHYLVCCSISATGFEPHSRKVQV